ncbi:MAG: dihydrofolate reductase family protein [Mycobacteriales bacterium]
MTPQARKLTVAALTTADGVHDSPRSFAGPYFDGDAAARSLAELQSCEAMLMGRTTYEYFVPAWSQATDPYARRVNEMTKYVYSTTLAAADWNNTTVVATDPVAAVTELKKRDGGDLMIYGYGRLARTLLEHGLVDVLKFSVFPVLAGVGAPLFRPGEGIPLRLESARTRPNGTVELTYTPE